MLRSSTISGSVSDFGNLFAAPTRIFTDSGYYTPISLQKEGDTEFTPRYYSQNVPICVLQIKMI
jgi:hypothetical protein